MKTKIIKSHYSFELEKDLARFLNREEVKEIVSVKYSIIYNKDSIYPETYTALVIYK